MFHRRFSPQHYFHPPSDPPYFVWLILFGPRTSLIRGYCTETRGCNPFHFSYATQNHAQPVIPFLSRTRLCPKQTSLLTHPNFPSCSCTNSDCLWPTFMTLLTKTIGLAGTHILRKLSMILVMHHFICAHIWVFHYPRSILQ
jgi:hypothetical protein